MPQDPLPQDQPRRRPGHARLERPGHATEILPPTGQPGGLPAWYAQGHQTMDRPGQEHETAAYLDQMVKALNARARFEDQLWAAQMQTQQGVQQVQQQQAAATAQEQQLLNARQMLGAILMGASPEVPRAPDLEERIAASMTGQPPETAMALQELQQQIPALQQAKAQLQDDIRTVFALEAEGERQRQQAPFLPGPEGTMDWLFQRPGRVPSGMEQVGAMFGEGLVSGLTGGAIGDISRAGGVLRQVRELVRQRSATGLPGLPPEIADQFLSRAAEEVVRELLPGVEEGTLRQIIHGAGEMAGMVPFFGAATGIGGVAAKSLRAGKAASAALRMAGPMPLLFGYGYSVSDLREDQKLALEAMPESERVDMEQAMRVRNGWSMSVALPFYHIAGAIGQAGGRAIAGRGRLGGAAGGALTGLLFPEAGAISEEVLARVAEDANYQAYLKMLAADGKVQAPILSLAKGLIEGRPIEELWADTERYLIASGGGAGVLTILGFLRGQGATFRGRATADQIRTEAIKEIEALDVPPEQKAAHRKLLETDIEATQPTPEAERVATEKAELERQAGGPEASEVALQEQVRAEEVPGPKGAPPTVEGRVEALEQTRRDLAAKPERTEEVEREIQALDAEIAAGRLMAASKAPEAESQAAALIDYAGKVRAGTAPGVRPPRAADVAAQAAKAPARRAAREAKVAAERPKRVRAELEQRKAAAQKRIRQAIPGYRQTLAERRITAFGERPLTKGEKTEVGKLHRGEVEQAISEGKQLRSEVLADYPDLVPQARAELAARGGVARAVDISAMWKPLHEMTQAEYLPKEVTGKAREQAVAEHKRLIQEAAAQGETIPEAVLADYPEFRPEPSPAPRPERPPVPRGKARPEAQARPVQRSFQDWKREAETTDPMPERDLPAEKAAPAPAAIPARPSSGVFAPAKDRMAAKVSEVMERAAGDLEPAMRAVETAKSKEELEALAAGAKDDLHRLFYDVAAEIVDSDLPAKDRPAQALYLTLKEWWPSTKADFRSLPEITTEIDQAFDAIRDVVRGGGGILAWDRWAADMHEQLHGPWIVAARRTEHGRKLIEALDAFQRPYYPVVGPMAVFLNPGTPVNRAWRWFFDTLQGRTPKLAEAMLRTGETVMGTARLLLAGRAPSKAVRQIKAFAATQERPIEQTIATPFKQLESYVGNLPSRFIGTPVGNLGEMASDLALKMAEGYREQQRLKKMLFGPIRGFFANALLKGKLDDGRFMAMLRGESPVETRAWRKLREEEVPLRLELKSADKTRRAAIEQRLREIAADQAGILGEQRGWWDKVFSMYVESRNPERMAKWPPADLAWWNSLPAEIRNRPGFHKLATEWDAMMEPMRRAVAETSPEGRSRAVEIEELRIILGRKEQKVAQAAKELQEIEAWFANSPEARAVSDVRDEIKRLRRKKERLAEKGKADPDIDRQLAFLNRHLKKAGEDLRVAMEEAGIRGTPWGKGGSVSRQLTMIGKLKAEIDKLEKEREQFLDTAYGGTSFGYIHHVTAFDWRKGDGVHERDLTDLLLGAPSVEKWAARPLMMRETIKTGPHFMRQHKLGVHRDYSARRSMMHYLNKVVPALYLNRWLWKWHPRLYGSRRDVDMRELTAPWRGKVEIMYRGGRYESLGEFYEFTEAGPRDPQGQFKTKAVLYVPVHKAQLGAKAVLRGKALDLVKRMEAMTKARSLAGMKTVPGDVTMKRKVILKIAGFDRTPKLHDAEWLAKNRQHFVIEDAFRLKDEARVRDQGIMHKLSDAQKVMTKEVLDRTFREVAEIQGIRTVAEVSRGLRRTFRVADTVATAIGKGAHLWYLGFGSVRAAVRVAWGAGVINSIALTAPIAARDAYLPFLYKYALRRAGLEGGWRDIALAKAEHISADRPFTWSMEQKIRDIAMKDKLLRTFLVAGKIEHLAEAFVELYKGGFMQGHRGSLWWRSRGIKPGEKVRLSVPGKVERGLMEGGLVFFDAGERFVREHLFLSAFMQLRGAGLSVGESARKATHAVMATQGVFNRATPPRWLKHPVGRMLGSLMSWLVSWQGTFYRLPFRQQLRTMAMLAVGVQLGILLMGRDWSMMLGTPIDETFGGTPMESVMRTLGERARGIGIRTEEDPAGLQEKPILGDVSNRAREAVLNLLHEAGIEYIPEDVDRIVRFMTGDLSAAPGRIVVPFDPLGTDTPVVSLIVRLGAWGLAALRGDEVAMEHTQQQVLNRLTPDTLKWLRRAFSTDPVPDTEGRYVLRQLTMDQIMSLDLLGRDPNAPPAGTVDARGLEQLMNDVIPGPPADEALQWDRLMRGRARAEEQKRSSRAVNQRGMEIEAQLMELEQMEREGVDVSLQRQALFRDRETLMKEAEQQGVRIAQIARTSRGTITGMTLSPAVQREWRRKATIWKDLTPRERALVQQSNKNVIGTELAIMLEEGISEAKFNKLRDFVLPQGTLTVQQWLDELGGEADLATRLRFRQAEQAARQRWRAPR